MGSRRRRGIADRDTRRAAPDGTALSSTGRVGQLGSGTSSGIDFVLSRL